MPNDTDLWQTYAKGVRKIRKVKSAASKDTSFPRKRESSVMRLRDKESCALPTQRNWIPACAGMTLTKSPPTSLDRRIEKNLRQGEIELHARIDLHGMTQIEAHAALARFMAAAVKAGKRNLLIITGKGRGKADAVAVARSAEQSRPTSGVLKTNLPLWLHALPEAPQILALRPAALKHGGDGAWYVVLRKGSGVRGRGSATAE